jgi:integrase/recombinase XerD
MHDKCQCAWWVDGVIDGRRYNKSLRTRNRNAAEDCLRRLEVGEATDPPPPVLLTEACEKFLLDALARKLREPTLYKYRLLFRRLKHFSESQKLHRLENFDVDSVRRFRETWPYSGVSANKRLEELRAFFRFCFESEWIAENPARRLKPAKIEDPPRVPFDEGEVASILKACDECPRRGTADPFRMRALIDLMLETGLRIGDAVQLKRSAISGGRLRLRTEKTGVDVCLPLSPKLIIALNTLRSTNRDYFFWSGQSRLKSCVGNWQRALKRVFRLAGVPSGCAHRFRHTFAKRCLLAGVPPDRVAILMGHSSQAITQKHYAQWVPERQEQLDADVRNVQRKYAGYSLDGETDGLQLQ